MNRSKFSKIVIYIVLGVGMILILIPFLWMVLTSFKDSHEIMNFPVKTFPKKLSFENYLEVIKMSPFAIFFKNSIIVTTLITIGELITTILAAFAFSKLKFWGRDILFTIMIATMMVPSEVLLIPNFITLSRLNWIDTYKALVIPWCASAFTIFLLRQYFLQIPETLYDAAKIDGCSDFKYLWKIMVPISRPALISIAILKIVGSWNAFMWPLIVTNSEELRTLPVALSYFSSEAGTDYNLLMAASTMIIIPMILVYVFLQKWIVDGLSKSGIKG